MLRRLCELEIAPLTRRLPSYHYVKSSSPRKRGSIQMPRAKTRRPRGAASTVIPVKAGIQYFPWTCSVLAAPPFQGSYTNQRLSMGPAASPGYSDGDVAVLARRQPIFMLSCHSSESGNPVFPRTRASHTIESQRWATFIHLHAYIFRDARGLRGCLSAVTAGTASGYGTREYDREFFKRLRPCR